MATPVDWKSIAKPVSAHPEFGPDTLKSDRVKLSKWLDKQLDLFSSPDKKGSRAFRVVGDNVAFKLLHAKTPLPLIGDETEVVVPKKDFAGVLGAIKAEVLMNKFDDGIKSVNSGETVLTKVRKARKPRTPKA